MQGPFQILKSCILGGLLSLSCPLFSQSDSSSSSYSQLFDRPVRTIEVSRHIIYASDLPVKSTEKWDDEVGDTFILEKYWFNRDGLAYRILFPKGQEFSKRVDLGYDEAGEIAFKSQKYRYFSEWEEIHKLADGNYNYYQSFDLLGETDLVFNSDSIIILQDSIAPGNKGNCHWHSEYDRENETTLVEYYENEKLQYRLKCRWIINHEKPDSVIYSWTQGNPKSGNIPSFSHKMKVLENGSVVPPDSKKGKIYYSLWELNFFNRYKKMWAFKPAEKYKAAQFPKVKETEIAEMKDHYGNIYKYYDSFHFEFYGE